MGHLIIGTVLAAIGVTFTIFVSVAGRLGADEFKAWSPWLTERLIDRAVARLPEAQRGQYAEKWQRHVDQVPGDLSKLFVALRYMSAATAMLRNQPLRARASLFMLVLGIILIIPALASFAVAIKLTSPRLPVLQRGDSSVLRFRFRTTSDTGQVTRLGSVLRRTSADVLPGRFDVQVRVLVHRSLAIMHRAIAAMYRAIATVSDFAS